MRLNQSTLALVLGSFSIAQAAVYDRNGRLERRQESAQPTGVNIASGLMGIVNRVLASATVTETVRQTITVGGDGAAGAIANATVTVTIAETTITVSAGQAGGDAAASTAPGNANGVIESGGASPTQSEVAATGGVGVVVIEVPEEARKTSLVAPEVPATSEAVVVPPTDGASTDLAIPTGAASSTDAATPTDAASATDSVSTDLATPTDAASSTDAATPTDAASATDSVSTDLATPTDAATSTDALASPTLLTPPGVATDAPAESSLLPLPGLESSSLAVLPILESSTEESAPASTTAADATASTSVPAEVVTTTEAASATSLAPLPGIASSLDSTLNLGGAGGAAQPTVLPSPDGAFGGVAGAIPIASAEVPPPPLPTATPGVANGADAGNTGNGGQVQIDLSGVELSRTLNLGNLVQARQTAVPAAAGAI